MIVVEENQIVIYKDENNAIQLDVKLKDGMIWVTRQQLATLFARDYKTISKHINNALREELADEVVVAKFANTTQHGAIEGKQQIKVLDVITTANTYKPTARLCRFHKGFVRPTERMSKKCQLKNGKTLL